jgi:superoxide dismutase, Fe-Mn family
MPFALPPLPYPYDALEPTIDAETMQLHHDKHHATYVDNLNAAIAGTEWDNRPLEQVLANVELIPEDKRTAVRNNGGGHGNHSMFWEIMSPDGGGAPSGAFAHAIDDVFGSLDELKRAVNDDGLKRFGSGWTWLIHDGTGLAVLSTANQDNPVMNSDEPILGIDVWEHAYYLKYRNRRGDYLEAWWDVVNWEAVTRRWERAIELAEGEPVSAG